jgi:biotin operon repressor
VFKSQATTTIPAAADDVAAEATQDSAALRALKVDKIAQQLYTTRAQAQQRKPPAERTKDAVLWKQAHREATAQVRRDHLKTLAKDTTRAAATTVYADVRSAAHRNRQQLAPWMIAAPYAGAGEAAHLLATYGSGSPVAISALCAASAGGASVLAWRKKLAKRTPGKFRAKMQAGLAGLCGWCAAMPLVPTEGQAGMWLSLLGGTAYLGMSWWRQHDHPIPLPDEFADLAVTDTAPAATQVTEADLAFADKVIADWDTFVAGMGTLPGSGLSTPQRVEYGWTFLLHLVRGKQKLTDARAAKDSIAAALNLEVKDLSLDRDTRPGADTTTVVLTVITEAVTNAYDGPRIVREGGDVFIEVGPYEDGIGAERFHVLSDQLTDEEIAAGQRPRGSMNGGFALGTKGSGKSRLMEEVAVGLRKLGIELWYLDPQGGKSSPALMAESDWPLAGMHGTKGAYSNVIDLWKALIAACEVREAEGGDAEQGFQHTRERPAIMVMIDECHGVFQADNPETENSFGQDFAELDRIMRKNGIGILGASQAITQDTFGRGNAAAVLRDGMCAVNVFLMAYGGKNLRLAPGYDDQPCGSLPTNQGYGYNPKGARPHTRWQSRYTPDFQPWLARYPRATLDVRVQKRIGTTYTRRFEQHAENTAAKQEWLAQLDAYDGDASTLPAFGQQSTKDDDKGAKSGESVVSLLSPHQRRLQTAGTAAGNEVGAGQDTADLTDAQQRALDTLDGESKSSTTVASMLSISRQGAAKHLEALATKGRAVKLEDGRYMAR